MRDTGQSCMSALGQKGHILHSTSRASVNSPLSRTFDISSLSCSMVATSALCNAVYLSFRNCARSSESVPASTAFRTEASASGMVASLRSTPTTATCTIGHSNHSVRSRASTRIAARPSTHERGPANVFYVRFDTCFPFGNEDKSFHKVRAFQASVILGVRYTWHKCAWHLA